MNQTLSVLFDTQIEWYFLLNVTKSMTLSDVALLQNMELVPPILSLVFFVCFVHVFVSRCILRKIEYVLTWLPILSSTVSVTPTRTDDDDPQIPELVGGNIDLSRPWNLSDSMQRHEQFLLLKSTYHILYAILLFILLYLGLEIVTGTAFVLTYYLNSHLGILMPIGYGLATTCLACFFILSCITMLAWYYYGNTLIYKWNCAMDLWEERYMGNSIWLERTQSIVMKQVEKSSDPSLMDDIKSLCNMICKRLHCPLPFAQDPAITIEPLQIPPTSHVSSNHHGSLSYSNNVVSSIQDKQQKQHRQYIDTVYQLIQAPNPLQHDTTTTMNSPILSSLHEPKCRVFFIYSTVLVMIIFIVCLFVVVLPVFRFLFSLDWTRSIQNYGAIPCLLMCVFVYQIIVIYLFVRYRTFSQYTTRRYTRLKQYFEHHQLLKHGNNSMLPLSFSEHVPQTFTDGTYYRLMIMVVSFQIGLIVRVCGGWLSVMIGPPYFVHWLLCRVLPLCITMILIVLITLPCCLFCTCFMRTSTMRFKETIEYTV